MAGRSAWTAVLVAAVLAAGCGGSGKPPVLPAGGKVMFKKTTPPVDALVVFHPVDPAEEKRIGGKPFAKVKEDGTFALSTYADGDGAPAGEYGVTIEWRVKPKDAKFALGVGDGGGGGTSALDPKYSNPQKPFTRVTVKPGDPNRFTFDVD
jgi:hypothetical protein